MLMPLTYSIAYGFIGGIRTYIVLNLCDRVVKVKTTRVSDDDSHHPKYELDNSDDEVEIRGSRCLTQRFCNRGN
ncbi:hypothetical protein VNO78_09660 [Psophocarpus tetragonolobus]|uniref:Uncharacterized protein n=1 Tax=Psophocarpus tetragonolobus TaxID=3891 RepID=A0AAN9XTD6_PSOTE